MAAQTGLTLNGAGTLRGELAGEHLALDLNGGSRTTLSGTAGRVSIPFYLPVLPPETYIHYAELLNLGQAKIETHAMGKLPQLFADRFGWPEMAQTAAQVYHSLSPEEQSKAAIFAENYGQAGAIDLYGPDLTRCRTKTLPPLCAVGRSKLMEAVFEFDRIGTPVA
jgi:hypothetical protein